MSPFLRGCLAATIVVIFSWLAIRGLERFESNQLEQIRAATNATRAGQPAADLDALDRDVEAVEAATTRWLVVYLPFLTLAAALIIATAVPPRLIWLAAPAALAPVAAAAAGLTAGGEGLIRLLPLSYPVAGTLVAGLLGVLAARRGAVDS